MYTQMCAKRNLLHGIFKHYDVICMRCFSALNVIFVTYEIGVTQRSCRSVSLLGVNGKHKKDRYNVTPFIYNIYDSCQRC